jgi:hypothetical protein
MAAEMSLDFWQVAGCLYRDTVASELERARCSAGGDQRYWLS